MKYYVAILLLLFTILPIRSVTKRALLVGISDYPSNETVKAAVWSSIHGANDVEILKKTLKNQGFQVNTLTNSNAKASNIRKAFDKLYNEVIKGDIVYIHFSCHGQPVEDKNGDEKDGWDESIVPFDAWKKPIKGIYDGKNHILDDELNSLVGKIRNKIGSTGFVYVVVDACHSGGIDRGEEDDDVYLRGTDSGFSLSDKAYIPRMDTRSNIPIVAVEGWADMCMLEACRAYQSNHEIEVNGSFYGPLSFYINQILKNCTLSSDTKWIQAVKRKMDENPKLINQNMVIQITK